MIRKSFRDFLATAGDLASCSERFIADISLGDVTIRNRNDARRLIRGEIGDAIYSHSQPQGGQHTAITLGRIASDTNYHLRGEYELRSDVVQCDVWTKGRGAAIRGPYVAELIRAAASSYRGSEWSKDYPVHVATVNVVRDNSFELSPRNASNDWAHRQSLDLDIKYSRATVEFSNTEAVADFEFAIHAAAICLVNVSTLATGRTAVGLQWSATDGGAPLDWDGEPAVPCNEAHAEGVYGDTQLDSTGLSGDVVITMIVTDDAGNTATVVKTVTLP